MPSMEFRRLDLPLPHSFRRRAEVRVVVQFASSSSDDAREILHFA